MSEKGRRFEFSAGRDARFARRAARESDGLNCILPGVALADSGDPGLNDSWLKGNLRQRE